MADVHLLEQLKALSALAVESADLAAIRRSGARDVNLGAARITAAAQAPAHAEIVEAALHWAQHEVGKGGNRKLAAIRAVERLGVEFARRALELVDGRVSLELDARIAFQTGPTVERARALLQQLGGAGISPERALIKIPATWEGIQAAAKLEQLGVHCHMTLVFGMHQAAACADACATVVSPAVGRITDWHAKQAKVEDFAPAEDPGVLTCVRMHHYLRRHGLRTELWPSTFRSAEQVLALAGCDGLSLPTALFDELGARTGQLERKLDPASTSAQGMDKLAVDAGKFSSMHTADPVSSGKLTQGVKNLSWAMVTQEKQLVEWITARQDAAAMSSAVALFRVWDYDGDGFIDREEWGGTDEVFNALDRNHDGRISLEEMATGLGAPFKPTE